MPKLKCVSSAPPVRFADLKFDLYVRLLITNGQDKNLR